MLDKIIREKKVKIKYIIINNNLSKSFYLI